MRVLARPAASSLNAYTNILYRHVRQLGIRVDSYQFARAVFGQYEIFHVHWPESVFNHGLLSARVTTEALLLAMKRLKQRGTKLIWTVHNLGAHDRRFPLQEAAFWRRFVPLLDGYFALSETGKHAAQQRFPALRGKAGSRYRIRTIAAATLTKFRASKRAAPSGFPKRAECWCLSAPSLITRTSPRWGLRFLHSPGMI